MEDKTEGLDDAIAETLHPLWADGDWVSCGCSVPDTGTYCRHSRRFHDGGKVFPIPASLNPKFPSWQTPDITPETTDATQ